MALAVEAALINDINHRFRHCYKSVSPSTKGDFFSELAWVEDCYALHFPQ
jgi:hypothetical protein